jgi:hypothetical protein
MGTSGREPTQVTTLHDLLVGYEADHQRERPTDGGLTASGMNHPCRRQQAYGLQGVEPSDDIEPVTAATVGTMLHAEYARIWQELDSHAIVERRGEHGQPDVIRERIDGLWQVRDFKTKNGRGFQAWVDAGGPDPDVWDQLRIYAYDAGLADDSLLIVDALDRDTGRTATFVESYLVLDGERALDDLHEIEDELLSNPPELIPTERTGDGDYFCDRCPWGTLCLGGRDTPPQVVRDWDETEVTAAASDYLLGSKLERDGKALKKAAKRVLASVDEPTTVGGYQLNPRTVDVPERTQAAYSYKVTAVHRVAGDNWPPADSVRGRRKNATTTNEGETTE